MSLYILCLTGNAKLKTSSGIFSFFFPTACSSRLIFKSHLILPLRQLIVNVKKTRFFTWGFEL